MTERWVTKVRRYGGGYSVVNMGSQEACQSLADDINEQYQTNNYYAEPWVEEKFEWPDLSKYKDLLDN